MQRREMKCIPTRREDLCGVESNDSSYTVLLLSFYEDGFCIKQLSKSDMTSNKETKPSHHHYYNFITSLTQS